MRRADSLPPALSKTTKYGNREFSRFVADFILRYSRFGNDLEMDFSKEIKIDFLAQLTPRFEPYNRFDASKLNQDSI